MDMGIIYTIKNRIYSDYFMKSRLSYYDHIISEFLSRDYLHMTVRDFYLAAGHGKLDGQRIFVHRHDIDTDVSTARKLFEIEKKHGVKATYYFRLSTLDFDFMREIDDYGSEVGYHFEELAAFCKKNHIKEPDVAMQQIEKIRKVFQNNFCRIESKFGRKISTVCSHGDFVNRALKLKNHEMTNSEELRDKLGILCEAYDDIFMTNLDVYVSDQPYPGNFSPRDIMSCIDQERRICLLTHPRHWRVNVKVNTFDNLKRLIEGILW